MANPPADDEEVREEGPLALNIPPTIPAHPRPGTRTIVATTAEYGRWRLSRVGLDLDFAIEEELTDYAAGLGEGAGAEADAYAAEQPDIALWEGERLPAVILPRAGGDPEVHRFDGGEDHRPMPTTLGERSVVALARDYGVEPVRQAILAKFMPNHGTVQPRPLTPAEESVLGFVRRQGEKEALERLHLAGPYAAIARAIDRLGHDAVDELRRMIEEGKLAS